MKKLLLTVFAATMSLAGAAANVGDEVTIGELKYTITSDTEASCTGYLDTALTADIQETIEVDGVTYTVTSVGVNAFKWSEITSAKIPNSVKDLLDNAFYNSKSLATVEFGTGLETIGRYAFSYTAVAEMNIPEGVTIIGNSAFFRADNLTKITFPSTLKEIGGSCFYKAPLENVVLPEGLEVLGKTAFSNCTKLTSITIPSSVTSIGERTFDYTALTSINLPEGVKSIGEAAFYGSSSLTEVVMPASLEEIGGSAFGATAIAKWNLSPENKNFIVEQDIIFTADKTLAVAFAPKSALKEVTLPYECIGISYGAFEATGIQKVTAGSKFRAIDSFAFCLSELTDFNFPETIVFIGEQAFAGTKLTKVVLPPHLPMLYDAVFADCFSLTEITLPASLTYLGIRNFYRCEALTTINCEAMTPPEIGYWEYTPENPFYKVPESAVCNIPAGTKAAYEKAWRGTFNGKFEETLAALIYPSDIKEPSQDSAISTFEGMTLVFDEKVTIVNKEPSTTAMREGPLASGVPIGKAITNMDTWCMAKWGDNEVRLFPADYDYMTYPIQLEAGKDYYITVPAGIIKNEAGELNGEFIVHFIGKAVDGVEGIETDNDVNAPVEMYTIDGVRVAEDNLTPGRIYIKRQGSKVSKVVVR